MKTLIAVSDSHGNRRVFEKLDGIFEESDYIVHLGDTSADGSFIGSKYPGKTVIINGNCDPVKLGEDEKVLEIEGIKIFMCHGHLCSVKTTLERLAARAKEAGCKIALYGHTHEAREDEIDGVTIINPGSLMRFSGKSYLYLVVNNDKFTYKIVRLR